jgi:tight adherence protein B
VSGTLLCAAAALLLWPARRRLPGSGPPARIARVRGVPRRGGAAAAGIGAGLLAGAVSTPLVAVLAGTAAVGAVRAARARAARTAEDERVRGLAEALGSLAGDLRAGRPTAEAAGAAVAACGDRVVGDALAGALGSADLPPPSAAARGRWEQAVGRVAAGVRLSVRTGCSLAAVACAVEDDLRAQLRLQGELRAATAAPRASALLLAGLPVLAFAMGSGIGADPWAVLTGTPVGQVLLVVGVGLEAAGLAWSARLVRRAVP